MGRAALLGPTAAQRQQRAGSCTGALVSNTRGVATTRVRSVPEGVFQMRFQTTGPDSVLRRTAGESVVSVPASPGSRLSSSPWLPGSALLRDGIILLKPLVGCPVPLLPTRLLPKQIPVAKAQALSTPHSCL